MNTASSYRIGVVGLGLIGGSLALALREAGIASHISAWDQSGSVLGRGLELGVIDSAAGSVDALLAEVDVAILATPTLASEALLPQMLANPGAARCITDVASVKGSLCDLAASLPVDQAARYVPGHPIAGSERHGVDAASAGLFRAHRVILTPLEQTAPDARAVAEALWTAAGAEVVTMSVADHDAILAATSHLPHMLAYALVDTLAAAPDRDEVFRFAAGGFRDFTRIASSDPVMWRDIALANRQALLAAIDGFSDHLHRLRSAIAAGDGETLEGIFGGAKAARDEFIRELEQRASSPTVAGAPTLQE